MADPKKKKEDEEEEDPDSDIFDGLDDDDAKAVDLAARARQLAHRRIERAGKPPEKKKKRGFLG
jgi:hypothetical protein